MARDRYHVFSDAQSVVLNAGAAAQSTDVIQLISGKDYKGTTRIADPSALGKMKIYVSVATALTAAVDGAVLTIALYEHTAATSIQTGNLIDSTTVTINTTATAVGTVLWAVSLPIDLIDEQYVGLYYSVATQNVSAGAVDAYLTPAVPVRVP